MVAPSLAGARSVAAGAAAPPRAWQSAPARGAAQRHQSQPPWLPALLRELERRPRSQRPKPLREAIPGVRPLALSLCARLGSLLLLSLPRASALAPEQAGAASGSRPCQAQRRRSFAKASAPRRLALPSHTLPFELALAALRSLALRVKAQRMRWQSLQERLKALLERRAQEESLMIAPSAPARAPARTF